MNSQTSPSKLSDETLLDGRVAVVTGASGGLGVAICERLVELGALVAHLDLQTPKGVAAPHLAISCDITDEASVEAAAAEVEKRLGRCGILVNNAGILVPHTSLQKMALKTWHRSLDVNLTGTLLCTQTFGQHMLRAGSGAIVNIASIAGSKANASPSYSVSKSAVLGLTRHTAVEWGPRGIRTNAVSPGFIQTPLSAEHYKNEDATRHRIGLVPVRRLGTPRDIANAVAFLASNAAAFINGQDLIVDGGFLETPLMHAQPKADQYGGFDAPI
ncbi:NAD(P)-dependent dehydrogenase (short-subunit alcohol dehydrogenase family) [Variovorax boronicumulans]|uniref:SDR family NAD(P)-dependent oxidoreductase n=1 Tax=Variovorax boronicumulans TaxID=436515 RepID=UPI002781DE7B|nr:SDR family oxidoreductase [Variovorax boronicumulans]MDP9995293.1 NAD(P)-dependent dehydrogenase (short-subunit alcohol dehydrogenase family) [Variovorax boronicumulans]MDQ0006583.1 NAD(P)-dependent dehydrogenase (short-subunit alcohol dehydrogenase family) [Variovorax boronicumulans]MDQ0044336.1 NAD(P)-dependent dehydrogenase (short-subunit alcohol dehydrogenase family) [Variovorax boronicumulans]